MDIEDIVNYVQKTPDNTNPNMLRNMLNNMNSSKPLIVHVSDNWTLDKTWREMYDYYLNKGFVIGLQKFNEEAEFFNIGIIMSMMINNDNYYLFSFAGNNMAAFVAASPDDYPTRIDD